MVGDRERCLAAGMDGYLVQAARPARAHRSRRVGARRTVRGRRAVEPCRRTLARMSRRVPLDWQRRFAHPIRSGSLRERRVSR